ncbi:hypothetical protein BKA57DRAFT_539701 [Linnemannia elongata]|nr:hypothetical protein BKA57DRAFT_539701 [Linnemannia elongata]
MADTTKPPSLSSSSRLSTQLNPTGGYKSSDLPPLVKDEPPKVLIVGAGLAGLYLGLLLETAGIPYEVFERIAEVKPLGGVMALSGNILCSFEQMGIFDEMVRVSKPTYDATYYSAELKKTAHICVQDELTGYKRLLFARPELYNVLFNKIPTHKIHMSKKVLSFQQNHEGVMLRFSDNTTVHGDILVGADGAHSGVRKHLYKTLDEQGLLPKGDTKIMNTGYMALVGTTLPLDPSEERYKDLAAEDSKCSFHIGDNSTPFTWMTYTVPGNRICWNVVIQLELAEIEEEQFRRSDWAPETNGKILDQIREFKTTYGPLGDIVDATPRERISKVFFEDMLFETWTHGRTVLIGDAAHKLLPSTGQGAVNAMIDSVVLANCLYDIKPTSYDNIKAALGDYREQRFENVKAQYAHSHRNAKLRYGHTLWERMFRYMILNWLPQSVMVKQIVKDSAYRPQSNFLPQAPQRGNGPVISQKPSTRLQKEREEEEKRAEGAAVSAVAV